MARAIRPSRELPAKVSNSFPFRNKNGFFFAKRNIIANFEAEKISRTMKILFYCDTVFGVGGVQRVLAVLSQALSKRHDVTILSTDMNEKLTMYGYCDSDVKFKYISYRSDCCVENRICKAYSYLYKNYLPHTRLTNATYGKSFFLPSFKKRLVDCINAVSPDVVIGVHAYLSLQLASIADDIHARTIGWMHNSYEAFFEKEHPYLPHLKEFFAQEMQNLDRIVVLCHFDAGKYRKCLGLNPEVIYNPLTLKPCGTGSPNNKKFISVGRFEGGHKGFDILLKAFALFAKRNAEWTLEIVGEGPDERECRKIIETNHLENRVTISPFTSDIQSHYAKASVYVLSSRWEGMPLVLVEAMSHGLSIIASDLPVTKELLYGKGVATFFKNGDIEDLADKLSAAAQSHDLNEMSAQAIAYSEHFNLNAIVKQWEQLL